MKKNVIADATICGALLLGASVGLKPAVVNADTAQPAQTSQIAIVQPNAQPTTQSNQTTNQQVKTQGNVPQPTNPVSAEEAATVLNQWHQVNQDPHFGQYSYIVGKSDNAQSYNVSAYEPHPTYWHLIYSAEFNPQTQAYSYLIDSRDGLHNANLPTTKPGQVNMLPDINYNVPDTRGLRSNIVNGSSVLSNQSKATNQATIQHLTSTQLVSANAVVLGNHQTGMTTNPVEAKTTEQNIDSSKVANANEQELPQTGNQKSALGLVGLAFALTSMSAALGQHKHGVD